jgi:hypothetical protein
MGEVAPCLQVGAEPSLEAALRLHQSAEGRDEGVVAPGELGHEENLPRQ